MKKQVQAPDGDIIFRSNFKPTEINSANFIFNMKEVVLVSFFILLIFGLIGLLFLMCANYRRTLGMLLRQFMFNVWIRTAT